MALDPKRFDVKAFDKAWAKLSAAEKNSKVGTDYTNQFLLPGAKPDSSSLGSTTNYDPKFGGIPGVPDPTVAAGAAIGGNLTNFDDLAKLTNKTNDLNFGQYTGRLPGYSDMSSTSSSNILSNLRGELPPDVLNLIGQQAAERGVSGGVAGSQFSNSDYLRSLGLTSLDLKSKGEAGFTGAMDRLKGIPTFDPASMFTKPDDVYNAGLQSSIFKSAPVPGAAAANNLAMATLPFDNAARSEAMDLWNRNRKTYHDLPDQTGSRIY